ncbi:MAG: Gfo/Idh/MocA family oxidoreductase [Alphaproteobacteria bacterium]|nr:Gfo/Idh/MocA family oxidoreductase [Alphaproteobacteria bacterium]
MRFGIVGAGMIAEFHAQAINAMPSAELVAVYARRSEAAAAFTETHGGTPYSDYGRFLAHQGLDIVTICTPSGAHLEPVAEAARAGKHIVCEKPLEVTTARVDEMIAVCQVHGVVLAGIFPRRFNEATVALKRAAEAGRFGRIALADATVKWWRPQFYYESAAWRGTRTLDGGGALMNQSIHTIDLLLHIMGDVASVRAEIDLIAHRDIEVEDTGVALVRFRSGALGVIQGSTACWSTNGHPAEIQICGDGGSVFMADDRFRVWDFKQPLPHDEHIRRELGVAESAPGAGAADPKAIDFRWHQRNFEDIVAAIEAGRPPAIDGAEARRAVALIEAIYTSADAGGEIVSLT